MAALGWLALVELIVVNPEVNDPLRMAFIMLTVAMTTLALILPSLLGDCLAGIKLGVMLRECEVASPEPDKPAQGRAVV